MIVYKSQLITPLNMIATSNIGRLKDKKMGKGVCAVRISISVKRIEVMLRLWVKRLDRGAKINPSPQSSLLSTFHSFAKFSL